MKSAEKKERADLVSLDARVFCNEGQVGKLRQAIVNPRGDHLTNLVVQENRFPFFERLVPVALVAEYSKEKIILECSRTEFSNLEPYVKTHIVETNECLPASSFDYYNPTMVPMVLEFKKTYKTYKAIRKEAIPSGEIPVHHGESVKVKNSKVGKVNKFVVNKNGNITHLGEHDILWLFVEDTFQNCLQMCGINDPRAAVN